VLLGVGKADDRIEATTVAATQQAWNKNEWHAESDNEERSKKNYVAKLIKE